ncbi:hypothetical protein Scep_015726 [Stephania cephalantha]|uniref:GH18 domain-containing protein n=1 Tax=Stephania cephalantha TaxID=152367 RepID=A0AAP0P331_9MAGN
MNPSKFLVVSLALQTLIITSSSTKTGNSNLFREYIGAMFKNVRFTDVPINPDVDFHFILAFAIDYTTGSLPLPTNGAFNIFWDERNLSPSDVSLIKAKHPNVRVGLSIGGDSVNGLNANFTPSSVTSWVRNAVSSLTKIIKEYDLDGIDIDYEHFSTNDTKIFADCIGGLIKKLKGNGIIKFASIAPFDNDEVQRNYLALWRRYGHFIDYVNFQFYAYAKSTTVAQFLSYFEKQRRSYKGGKVLTSFNSDNSRGLIPDNGFFKACSVLKSKGELHGIFVWCADDSKEAGFPYEKQSQELLTN